MSKILAISDIHIHDYPQRNPTEKYRLYQTRIVAQNIIEAGANNGCDVIVIAGDIIDKSIIRPYVQAEVKGFLDNIMSHFRVGYIIWGNHDQDNKGSDQDFTDSCLSVMLPPNLYYADRRGLTIDGTRIAFSNWRPEIDLSWINGKVDVLFTHATIAYSENDIFTSQKLDESKFDLAICGDIHRPATIGKYVSIGIPQKCKMGDSDDQTGIVYDCPSKTYTWINLNPHNNLMRFQYTPDTSLEGWDPNTGMWSVYKPLNVGMQNGIGEIKIPAWKEIDNLINNVILSSGLQEVHSDVLKNIKNLDSKEVDFNFVLTRFYCKNWRSIDEAEIFFNAHDKILITGKNGSGKSSLLSAMKYAFLENRSIKDFIQFGAKECTTEIEFLYQGNSYKIQRGSKKYGFWIGGELQKYNNKSEFEKDMHIRFPFIDYMDVYFFDSDHHKLIGGISPERKSEIISKFFKMDKIDAYNEEAEIMLGLKIKNATKWTEEENKEVKLLDFINSKLSVIVVPEMNESMLLAKRQQGYELQNKFNLYNSYIVKTADLQAKKKNLETEIVELEKTIRSFRDPGIIEGEITSIEAFNSDISQKFQELSNINSDGKRIYEERQNLDKTKFCRLCGQPIKSSDQLESHKAELDKKIAELIEQQKIVYKYLEDKGISKEIVKDGFAGVISKHNQEIASLMSELETQKRTTTNFEDYKRKLRDVESQLGNLGSKPEEVVLPGDFIEQMGRIESDLAVWKEYNTLVLDKQKSENNIQVCENELNGIRSRIAGLQEYIKLTGTAGKIYEEILNNLATQFSDNQVKYEVKTYTAYKKDHLDLASYFINNGNPVGYQACSSGQQTVLDVNFLSKIITGMGLLVMDEFLKHLDPFNHDLCIDAISQMNIGCTMISSHMESIAAFNNKSLKMELNDSGITKITCE